jgi:drug/metabolite transporter (DMT)-like permease
MNNLHKRKTAFPPIAVLFFGILSVSAASIMIRFAQREAPSLVISFFRLGVADLILAPFVITRYRKELSLLSLKQFLILVLAGLFLAVHFAAWITSLEYTTVASSVVLVTSVPLWVAIVSPFILHERVPRLVIIGMVVALVGGTIVGISSSLDNLTGVDLTQFAFSSMFTGKTALGNFLALIGAWMSAGYLLIGRGVRSKISLIPYIFVVYGIAAFFLFFMVLYSGEKFTGYSPETYFWLVALGIVPQLLGHSSFNWALGYLSATYVSVALLGEPIGATIMGAFLLKEMPSLLEIIGGMLLLFGIYLASRAEQSPG